MPDELHHSHPADGEIELLRVQGQINAEPILAALRANGIPARTVGEALGSVYGLTLDGLGEVTIVVPLDFEEQALELLAAADADQLALADDAVEPLLANLAPPRDPER